MDQPKARINWAEPRVIPLISELVAAFKVNKAIKIKINSPAYKLPNNRKAKEMGFATRLTSLKQEIKGYEQRGD